MIINFTASHFRGECMVDEDFAIPLKGMNEVAIRHSFLVIVTSSGRKDTNVAGAIVVPAKMGNHLVFHAIDFNLKSLMTGKYYNSTLLGDGEGEDEVFCREVVQKTGLFWGIAFKVADSVHIDDRLNVKDPELWLKKYNEIHKIAV